MLKPTFKPFIPVSSLSFASKFTIHVFPSVVAFFRVSISSSYPNFIIPPSFTLIGGSSTIEFSINSYISCNVSNSSYKSFNKGDSAFAKICFISGNCATEFFSEIKSLPFAFP